MGEINERELRKAERLARRANREQQQQQQSDTTKSDTNHTSTGKPIDGEQSATIDGQQSAAGIQRRKSTTTTATADNEKIMAGLAEVAQPNKRKRRTSAAAKAADPGTVKLVAGLFGTIFGLTSTRAGAHWVISEQEALQLAEPTVQVLNKYGLLEKLTKHSEILALGLAVSAIVAPRAIVSVTQIQAKRKLRKGVPRHVPVQQQQTKPAERQPNTQATENAGGGGQVIGNDPGAIPPDDYQHLGDAIVSN